LIVPLQAESILQFENGLSAFSMEELYPRSVNRRLEANDGGGSWNCSEMVILLGRMLLDWLAEWIL